jgi:predicted alpha/beta hydrolase family esterase
MSRAILVHGWGGTPEHGWFPWLKKELERRSWQVEAPLMPNTDEPVRDEWVAKLREVVGAVDDQTYLVSHSLGCITALRFLESLEAGQKIGGMILVAGFPNDLKFDGYRHQIKPFVDGGVSWSTVRAKCDAFFLLQSQDDEWVNPENYHELRERLNCDGMLTNGNGHYSGDDGVTDVPILLEKLLEMAA